MLFSEKVLEAQGAPLTAHSLTTIQVNLGYRCNMSCSHCHAQAGPKRTEAMADDTITTLLSVLAQAGVGTLDITGGAPELHPRFSMLVEEARRTGCRVIVRSNLTILLGDSGSALLDLYRRTGVEIIASLPSYRKEQVDCVRGEGAFEKSIRAIRELNSIGYGMPGGNSLSFVFNPSGAFLPPGQEGLEQEYRRELSGAYGISFDRLYTIANMPLGRFRDFLARNNILDSYLQRLRKAFNPNALESVMCRQLVSVGWDGTIHDCDFNQMAGVPVTCPSASHIRDFDSATLRGRAIAVAEHCYGCTAGHGST